MLEFDIVVVTDARFTGGTSTAVATEIEAAADAGYRVGLLHVHGSVLRQARAIHPRIRTQLDLGSATWIDPAAEARCQLLIVHHPMIFAKPLLRPLRIRSDKAVLVAHHPRVNGNGRIEYDIATQVSNIALSFGREPIIAPVGPAVRAGLSDPASLGVKLTSEDWHNLIDLRAWPAKRMRSFRQPIVIGRHARPDLLKWPDERAQILQAYPDDARFEVRILGAPDNLASRLGDTPKNWHLHPFNNESPLAFLHGLDAYVYFHSASWIEAFGYSVLEALAVGLPVVAPRSFEALFGEAVVCAELADVKDTLLKLASDKQGQRSIGNAARACVRDNFSVEQFRPRLERLFDTSPTRFAPSGLSKTPVTRVTRTVMFVSSNGIGLGHLTRQLAIAKRLPPWIKSVFFSMSRAVSLVRDQGYLVEHTPFHRYTGALPEDWNRVLAQELFEALKFHKPAALIFDGNVPYSGLLEASRRFPTMSTVWIRRAMWRGHHGKILHRSAKFDAIVEPGEIAGELDDGPTASRRGETILVDPVLMIRPTDRWPRNKAREYLGLNAGDVAMALQLGAGNNFDFAQVRRLVVEQLLANPRVKLFELVSPLAEHIPEITQPSGRHRIVQMYPTFMFSNAFDGAVSAAGYNSFHEAVLGELPTLFVPNEADEMDMQATRARHAELKGYGLRLGADVVATAGEQVGRLLDGSVRHNVRANCRKLKVADGAMQIARLVEEILLAAR